MGGGAGADVSEQSIIALVAVIASAAVGLASLAFNFWNVRGERAMRLTERQEDNHQWYRRTLFEKRLQAAQDAFSWWRRLNEAVSRASDNADPNSEERQSVREIATQAREWYDENSLYLEGVLTSKSDFVGLTNTALVWAGGRDNVNIQESLRDCYKFVQAVSNRLLTAETPTGMTQ